MELPANKRILSGMRSSNPRLHIGNYEGALRNWVDLQNKGFDMYCMVADLHALTTMYENPHEVSQNAREVAKDYIAAGIDPAKSAVFVQSHVREHSELHLLFSMMTPLGWLERVPTYKEKVNDLSSSGQGGATALLELLDSLREVRTRLHGLGESDRDKLEGKTFVRSRFGEAQLLQTSVVDKAYFDLAAEDSNAKRTFHFIQRSLQSFAASAVANPEEYGPVENWIGSVIFSLEEHLRHLVSIPYGLLGYPVLQTVDILLYKPYGVPVGRDQAPHLEIGNDIALRFNRLYGKDVFTPYKYMIPEDESRAKVPGLDMRKMSKSYDNCIYLSDTEDQTAARIKSAFTTPTKIKKDDPGIPEGCAVCQYLRLYSPQWQTQWDEDRQGLRGCMQNKRELTEALNEYLRPIRERRASLDDATIEDILKSGAERARERAAQTMAEVRDAMGMF